VENRDRMRAFAKARGRAGSRRALDWWIHPPSLPEKKPRYLPSIAMLHPALLILSWAASVVASHIPSHVPLSREGLLAARRKVVTDDIQSPDAGLDRDSYPFTGYSNSYFSGNGINQTWLYTECQMPNGPKCADITGTLVKADHDVFCSRSCSAA